MYILQDINACTLLSKQLAHNSFNSRDGSLVRTQLAPISVNALTSDALLSEKCSTMYLPFPAKSDAMSHPVKESKRIGDTRKSQSLAFQFI